MSVPASVFLEIDEALTFMVETLERNTGEPPTVLTVSAEMFDKLVSIRGVHRPITVYYRGSETLVIRESEEASRRIRNNHTLRMAAVREAFEETKRREALPHPVWGTEK